MNTNQPRASLHEYNYRIDARYGFLLPTVYFFFAFEWSGGLYSFFVYQTLINNMYR